MIIEIIKSSGEVIVNGQSLSGGEIAGANHKLLFAIKTGSPNKAASASATNMPTFLGGLVDVQNVAQTNSIYYLHTVTAGSAQSTNIRLMSFTYPNGAN